MKTTKSNDKPRNLISITEAKEQLNYFKKAHPGVNGKEYALRSWVSIDELEKYIQFVRKEAKEKHIDVSGIAFIYTQHKEGSPEMPNLSNEDFELTFMYAPTYKEDSKNIAFDPFRSEVDSPAKLSDLLVDEGTTASRGAGSSNMDQDELSGIANHINSCPNMCL